MCAMKLPDLAKQLGDLLKPQGFSLKSSTWRREHEAFTDVIEFEKRHDQFTVNVGVLTKSVHAFAWSEPAPTLPQEVRCTVRCPQLTGLFERGKWWDLDDATALSQIADHVRDLVLPFMDRMHSRDEQILYLRERQKSPFFKEWTMLMFEAILMHENGEQAEACSKLRNWKPNRYEGGGSSDRYNEIADRLGCPKL